MQGEKRQQEKLMPVAQNVEQPVVAVHQSVDYAGYNERFNRVMAYAEKHLEVTRQLVDTQQRMILTMRKDLAQLSALAVHEGDILSLEHGDTAQEIKYAFDQFSYHAHLNGQVVDYMLKVLDGECAIVTQLEQNNRGPSLEQKVHERNALLQESPAAVHHLYEAVMEQAFDSAQEFEGQRKEYLAQMHETFAEMQNKIRALCQDV